MRIVVAGAGGVIGRRLVPALLARGHQVTGTATTPASQARIATLGADAVVLNGLDADAVSAAVAAARPDVVVHQMTALAGRMSDLRHFDRTFARTNRLRREGTDHLLAAAREAGVGTVVAASFAGWPADPARPGPATETDPFDPAPASEQVESLAALVHLETAVTSAPLRGVVLRYGMFYGGDASLELLEAVRRRGLPIIGSGAGIWPMTQLDDAVGATVLAVEDERAHGCYIACDDEQAPVREFLPALARAVGAKRPVRVPAAVARLIAGEVPVRMMTRSRGASNARLRGLGWTPRWPTWRDGIGDWAATNPPA